MELKILGGPDDLQALVMAGRIQETEPGVYNISNEERNKLYIEKKLVAVVTIDGKDTAWNPAYDRDPRTQGNKNAGEKCGFRFSPYVHAKGQFFQNVIKVGMIKAINQIHKQVTKGYDEEAYIFDDPRLQYLASYLRIFVSENFQDGTQTGSARKLEFMTQIVDIVLFLMKEDIYYRARFFKLFGYFAEFPREMFVLSEQEEENFNRWH